MSMSRGERRRQERSAAKRPVIIAGDGVVATTLDHTFEAVAHAQLPEKVPGVHRWVATTAYVVSMEDVAGAHDADRLKFLDHENLMHLALGCWDCEQPLGAIDVDSYCPGDPS